MIINKLSMKQYFQKHKEILIICSISLLVRLIVMPFAQSTDADATSRVFIAQELLDNFRLILSGHWAPFHHYINALSLLIIPNNVYGPKIFHILFAVASCIPLYYFTKNEFNKQGAFFVTLIYTFSPVVFKNSFLAMAEVPYAFFVLLSMYFISQGTRKENKIKYSIFAGLSLTIAGGIRYEAWELMALFFIVLALFKQWKMLIPFGIAASIFPIFWMIGNKIETGDFLYSFNSATSWINNLSGINDNVSKADYIHRLIFFPMSWGLMITPLLSLILIYSIFKLITKKPTKSHLLIWLIPFIVIMVTYMYSAFKGTLFTQHRFTITLVLLSVPFLALFFENESNLRLKKIIVTFLIILMIPLSFLWNRINEVAIPLIKDDSVEAITYGIRYQLDNKKGLVLDFIGWDKSYYIALTTGATYKNTFLVDGTAHGIIYTDVLSNFFNQYPEGIIMIKANSKLDAICHSTGSLLEIEKIPNPLYLEKFLDFGYVKVFKYYLKSKEWAEKYKAANYNSIGITNSVKDIAFYKNVIKSDINWLNAVETKAKKRNISLDEMINLDAQWMVDQDLIAGKK
jgi:4-amino-4-deoxy-L-arabinose transferase-like glycosyltransferase